jgi:hypothetical protein
MNHFDIVPYGSGVSIKVSGSTRAGMLVAAVKGIAAATESAPTDAGSSESDRTFSLKAKDFGELTAILIQEMLSDVTKHGEAYSDVKFTLITDKAADGAFIARPGKMSGAFSLSTEQAIEPAKNGEGMWETEFVLVS